MTLTGPQTPTRCTTAMTKAHIDGTVDVELFASQTTIQWGENQLSVEYGGEVSTVDLLDDGTIDGHSENVAPNHSQEIVDLAIGFYEQAHIMRNEE